MHERIIAEELVNQACHLAKESQMARITRLRVGLGEDSNITDEALSFWFDLVKEGTLAETVNLEIQAAEGRSILLLTLQGED
jgi:Zn finger protein HypA/HybF involved in hydrogenase expression